jgi:hypothetical protein
MGLNNSSGARKKIPLPKFGDLPKTPKVTEKEEERQRTERTRKPARCPPLDVVRIILFARFKEAWSLNTGSRVGFSAMMVPDVKHECYSCCSFWLPCMLASLVAYMLSFQIACVRPAVHVHRAGLLLLVAFTSAW